MSGAGVVCACLLTLRLVLLCTAGCNACMHTLHAGSLVRQSSCMSRPWVTLCSARRLGPQAGGVGLAWCDMQKEMNKGAAATRGSATFGPAPAHQDFGTRCAYVRAAIVRRVRTHVSDVEAQISMHVQRCSATRAHANRLPCFSLFTCEQHSYTQQMRFAAQHSPTTPRTSGLGAVQLRVPAVSRAPC